MPGRVSGMGEFAQQKGLLKNFELGMTNFEF